MMNLIFMRHGEAGPYVPNDAGRQLTEHGIKQAQDSGRRLAGLYRPNLLITSPFDRARQTSEQVLLAYERLGIEIPTLICDAITPDADPEYGLDRLYELYADHANDPERDTLLVVCHMPIVAHMCALMTGSYHADGFELAEYRVLSADYLAQGLGRQVSGYVPQV